MKSFITRNVEIENVELEIGSIVCLENNLGSHNRITHGVTDLNSNNRTNREQI